MADATTSPTPSIPIPAPSRTPPPPPVPKKSLTASLTDRALAILHASATAPLNILRLVRLLLTTLLHSPSLTGVLLLLLTRGPEQLRARLRGGIGFVVLRGRVVRSGGGGAARAAEVQDKGVRGVVGGLAALFVLGVVRQANEAANAWALRGRAPLRLFWRRKGAGEDGGEGGGAGVWDFGVEERGRGRGWFGGVGARVKGAKGEEKTGADAQVGGGEEQSVAASGGEIVVVTGGCSGIGAEIVRGLLEGAGRGKVTIVVVDVQVLPEEFEERDEIVFYFCDLASSASIHEACAAIRSEVGDPSVLINNAGIARSCDLLADDDAYNDRLFRVNVLALFTLVREFVPGMLAARKGHVVTIASTASFVTPPGMVDYCASKAAALSLHEGLSTELRTRYAARGGRHILTTVMHPGWVGTTLVNGWKSSLVCTGQTLISPRVVADRVVANVLEARPGQLFEPEKAWTLTALRAAPHWLQDAYRDGIGKQTVVVAPTTKGKEKERERERQREGEKGYEMLES
ncbi:uncharacterized protein J3D65DRAFT_601820 [Phyllosticta citribraziliensis]|uniref:Uncharacterized protein n=1 Tax=Phyllosticta citribraziliensis TaxID=989973 RepID=A0ABR1LX71_9PEZI